MPDTRPTTHRHFHELEIRISVPADSTREKFSDDSPESDLLAIDINSRFENVAGHIMRMNPGLVITVTPK